MLRLDGYIELPAHAGPGGFDHAAVHSELALVFIAHRANDTLDVVDLAAMRLVRSIRHQREVAGVVVSEELGIVVATNRAEDTVAILAPTAASLTRRINLGPRPSGLAIDPRRGRALVASLGDESVRPFLAVVDLAPGRVSDRLTALGPRRWAVFDPATDAFYVTINDPPLICVTPAASPGVIGRTITVPAAGPHGLELDGTRLVCACDGGWLVVLDARSGTVVGQVALAGKPDVVFVDRPLRHAYVAVGDPGCIDVVDVDRHKLVERLSTEPGTHSLGFDPANGRVYPLLAGSHRVAVLGGRSE